MKLRILGTGQSETWQTGAFKEEKHNLLSRLHTSRCVTNSRLLVCVCAFSLCRSDVFVMITMPAPL